MASTLKLNGLLLSRNYPQAHAISTFFPTFYSTDVHRIQNPNLSALPKGTGGRSSFNGQVATVFGSSGFLGRYVCNQLGKIGTQLILPYRGESGEMLRLKLVGDLGQVLFQPYNLRDDESILKAISYSNVVINLVGRDWETKNFKFEDIHEHWPRKLAKMCRECDIKKLIHVSALNASESPEGYMLKGGSKFLSSKWKGEVAVQEEFPDAVIFRPSDIYGQEDRFLRYYCGTLRHQGKWMPLYKKGEHTVKQPVFISDVAAGIVAACLDKDAKGIYQAVGPKRYLLSELVDWFHRIIRKTDNWGYWRYDMRFDPIFQLRVSLSPYMTLGFPLGHLHWERVEREAHSDNVDSHVPTLEDLGVELTHMENQVPWELKVFKAQLYYDEELGEFEPPSPPQSIVTN